MYVPSVSVAMSTASSAALTVHRSVPRQPALVDALPPEVAAAIGLALLTLGVLVGAKLLARVPSVLSVLRVRARFPEEVPIAEGDAVAVEGTVAPADDTLEAPRTGEVCVAFETDVQEYRSQSGRTSGSWTTVDRISNGVRFRLAADGSSAWVDPTGASLDHAETTIVSDDGTDRKRYVEHVVRPDDIVCVYGQAQRIPAGDAADGEHAVGIADGRSVSRFTIAPGTKRALDRRVASPVLKGVALGGVLVAAGWWLFASAP